MFEDRSLPLVSIITPSFNQSQFLEDTILSVARQDYPTLEYMIIDGASEDNTINIIRKYEGEITYWISERDKGQTDAILKALALAKGKYFMWLCSDDLLEPSMISISVKYLEQNPDVVMTYGDRVRYDAKSNLIGYHRYCNFRPWLLKLGFAIPQETSLIRMEAYQKSGGLDRNLHMAMDFDLFCKLNNIGKIHHLPMFLGRFRSHDKNKSSIFDKSFREKGISGEYPSELAAVYYSHFKRKFPVFLWKKVSKLNEILAFIDRRSNSYKKLCDKLNYFKTS